jgi:hypothetical protein
MPLKQKHFTQHQWIRPKRSVFQRDGDFFKCYGLSPVLDGQALERAPTWSDLVNFPATPAHIAGAFFDHANTRYVFLDGFEGQGTDLRAMYFNSSWTASGWTTLVSSQVLGGLVYRNVHYWAGYIWFIDDDGDLYQTTSYTVGSAPVYQASFGLRIIWPIGDHMYAVDNDGHVYISNEGSLQLDSFFEPDTPLDVRWICAYKQYICLIARSGDGTLQILKLPDLSPLTVHQLATTLHTSGLLDTSWWSLNFALHDDYVYLIPGYYTRQSSGETGVLHRFNGTYLERLTRTKWDHSVRLVPWRGRLLAVQGYGGQNYIDQLIDEDGASPSGEWVRMLDRHADQVGRYYAYPKVWNLGEELICTMANGSGNPALRHIGAGTLCDGWLITSAYDMGLPARQKRLNHITVHTDVESDADTDFKIVVKYRIDDYTHRGDDDNWTTAVTANGTPRAVTAELGVEFYLLQVRVDVDDDSGSNLDRKIEAITIDYSAGD